MQGHPQRGNCRHDFHTRKENVVLYFSPEVYTFTGSDCTCTPLVGTICTMLGYHVGYALTHRCPHPRLLFFTGCSSVVYIHMCHVRFVHCRSLVLVVWVVRAQIIPRLVPIRDEVKRLSNPSLTAHVCIALNYPGWREVQIEESDA